MAQKLAVHQSVLGPGPNVRHGLEDAQMKTYISKMCELLHLASKRALCHGQPPGFALSLFSGAYFTCADTFRNPRTTISKASL